MAKKELYIPFVKSLKHDTVRMEEYTRRTYPELEERTFWNEEFFWRKNYQFDDELEYAGYSKGRSSVRVKFVSTTTGERYSMTISNFDDIAKFLVAGKLKGRFTFVKQGANYGLKVLKSY